MPTDVTSVAADYIDTERQMELRSAAASSALDATANALSKSQDELVARDLQPETDLGQTNNRFVLTVNNADQFDEVVNTEVGDGKTITIFAVSLLDANPDVDAIRFSDGASTKNELVTEQALVLDQPTLFLESPIKFEENDTLDIALYAETTGDKKVVVHGVVSEERGENIQPNA